MTLARKLILVVRNADTGRVPGAALLLAGETAQASKELEWSLREKDLPMTRLMLARVRHQQDNATEARKLYDEAVKRQMATL